MRSFYTACVFLSVILLVTGNTAMCQCSSYPVPFEQRISKAAYIVQGKVIEKHTYIDATTGGINTLNKFKVAAWLKNYSSIEDIYVITLGGVYGNRAMRVDPALKLDMQHEYLLMLEPDNRKIDDKNFRLQHPQALQLLTYADAQGSLTNEQNLYHDLYYRTPKPEQTVFEEISRLTNQMPTKPSGELFVPRPVKTAINNGVATLDGFSPSTVNAGTIVAGDQLTITGSGFGMTEGTVFFKNADDGGATFTGHIYSSDIISWGDASITIKPIEEGGSGVINVNGPFTSALPLTIPYAHSAINSDFDGFGTPTRQRYYLRNKNGLGGYYYTYNTAFYANTAARLAFERAMLLWRCNTFIYWRSNIVTSAITTAAVDGVNIVVFDASLPAGVLGRATSYMSGNSNGSCNLANTVWWLNELDIQFAPDPPVASFGWQFGPASPSTAQYDFESVALHELGHHHGLGHAIEPTADVMHYALANGATRRILSANNIAGGNAKVVYSATTCFNPPGSGTPMIALNPGNCTLLLELTEFRGERKNASSNKLNWSTANELNNYGFYLQRSADAVSFTEMAFIKGSGNNSQPASYEFMDTKAGPFAWYYWLRQVDLDGKQKISKTIFINGDNNTTAKVWASETGDKVFVYLKQGVNDHAVLKIVNAQGQQVLLKQIYNNNSETAVAHLPKGIYYYQLLLNGKIMTGKILLGTP